MPSWHPKQEVSYFFRMTGSRGRKRGLRGVYILWCFSLLGRISFFFFFSGKRLGQERWGALKIPSNSCNIEFLQMSQYLMDT